MAFAIREGLTPACTKTGVSSALLTVPTISSGRTGAASSRTGDRLCTLELRQYGSPRERPNLPIHHRRHCVQRVPWLVGHLCSGSHGPRVLAAAHPESGVRCAPRMEDRAHRNDRRHVRPAGPVFDGSRCRSLDPAGSDAASSLGGFVRGITRGRTAGRSFAGRLHLRLNRDHSKNLGRAPDARQSALHAIWLGRAGLARSLSCSACHPFRDRPADAPAVRAVDGLVFPCDSTLTPLWARVVVLPSQARLDWHHIGPRGDAGPFWSAAGVSLVAHRHSLQRSGRTAAVLGCQRLLLRRPASSAGLSVRLVCPPAAVPWVALDAPGAHGRQPPGHTRDVGGFQWSRDVSPCSRAAGRAMALQRPLFRRWFSFSSIGWTAGLARR